MIVTEGSLEVKLPTIWTDEKQSRAEAERREKIRREKSRRERVRKKRMQMCEKVGKSRNTVFFPWFEAPEGRKVGSLKRRVRSQLARWEMKNCTPLPRTTFGSWDVEKVNAVVARSTFRCQNVKSTRGSDHFWTLWCRSAWQVQGIVDLVESEQNVRVLLQFQKRWQAWDFWRGSAKMHFPWQAQYKRYVHERC